MKKIILSILVLGGALIYTSCDDFLTYEPSNSVSDQTAFNNANDIENGLNGLYYSLGRYQFMGRNVIALGDIAADNCYMTGSTGHFDQIYKYTISPDNADLLDIWDGGYKVINRAAKLIKAGKTMLSGDLSATDESTVKSALAQAYEIKALSHFMLVNIFSLPYSDANKSSLGIVVVGDDPVVAFQDVERSTVEQTYTQILADIQSASQYIDEVDAGPFIMSKATLNALSARVYLYMKNWSEAITAAENAITNSGGSIVTDAATYYNMWASVAPTSEDIFTIAKLSNDNLSANSLNTLYDSYDGKATTGLYNLFGSNDMRLSLFTGAGQDIRALKYMGLPSSAATSNIPVFRLPEMYLIIAEAKAHLNQADAVDYLWEIAQRNPDLAKADIPTDQAGLLNFISVERRRELFQEGHRWFDIRRTGEIMTRIGGNYPVTNWDASKFAYPIPANEINASGIQQNSDWSTTLP